MYTVVGRFLSGESPVDKGHHQLMTCESSIPWFWSASHWLYVLDIWEAWLTAFSSLPSFTMNSRAEDASSRKFANADLQAVIPHQGKFTKMADRSAISSVQSSIKLTVSWSCKSCVEILHASTSRARPCKPWLTRFLSKFDEHSIKQPWSLDNLVFTKIKTNAAAENKDDDSGFIKDWMKSYTRTRTIIQKKGW